jgi:probable addiction module antidote protein
MKQKPKVTYSTFHVSDYLDNEKVIAEYLSSAAQDENPDVLLKALGDVAKARGMAQRTQASVAKAFTRHSAPEPSRDMKPSQR